MKDNFQQWISWLLHRWRTQRNAIRNVNCRSVTHRNFERTLHLVVFRQVCLFECLCTLSLFFFLWGLGSFNRRGRALGEKKKDFGLFAQANWLWAFAACFLTERFTDLKVLKAQPGLFDGLVLNKLIHVVSFALSVGLLEGWAKSDFFSPEKKKHTHILLDLKSSKATRWT